MEGIKSGETPYHFIEVMGCPGGCISGGGQPRLTDHEKRLLRIQALYTEDEGKQFRKSHDNPYIQQLYEEYLGHPLGHISHELLHTTYTRKSKY
jgi:iron only hydrogenase large subunit-like protein